MEDFIHDILVNHRGKAVGVILGLAFGLLTVFLGFWKALFIAICIAAGFFIGKRLDEDGEFKKKINRIIGKK